MEITRKSTFLTDFCMQPKINRPNLSLFASDQNVVKIMVLYFPKIYGFPMLRSTQRNEKSILLSSGS